MLGLSRARLSLTLAACRPNVKQSGLLSRTFLHPGSARSQSWVFTCFVSEQIQDGTTDLGAPAWKGVPVGLLLHCGTSGLLARPLRLQERLQNVRWKDLGNH